MYSARVLEVSLLSPSGSVQTVRTGNRRLAASRSRKTEKADGKGFNDPYAQACPTMYGKISRAAFHIAQQSATQRPGSREQAPEADELWERPGHHARHESGSASVTSAALQSEQVSVFSSLT